MPRTVRRVVLLPRELDEQVRAIARREHRSVSAQIVHFLAQAVAAAPGSERPPAGRDLLSPPDPDQREGAC